MAGLGIYDGGALIVVMAGIPIKGGFGPDSVFSIEQNESSFTTQIGTDGEGCRSKTNNRSAKAKLVLMQSSAANDLLSQLHNLDDNSSNGAGVGMLLVKDATGRTIVDCPTAWIEKRPVVDFAREAGVREWSLETDRWLPGVIGGNIKL